MDPLFYAPNGISPPLQQYFINVEMLEMSRILGNQNDD